ncbi:MAG: zincin-like metallopeptidase domain-containing protein [Pseudomonadota bacterium]
MANRERADATPRRDPYKEVTDKIIAELEKGRAPWVQPWASRKDVGGTPLGLPLNASTGRTYSGINILLPWSAAIDGGREAHSWLTFKQVLVLGGCVRKGERGTMVVYADTFTPKAEQERAAETGEAAQTVGFLKRYTVFNIAQCDGLPETVTGSATPLPEREIIPRAEAAIKATGADFRIGGDRAFYVPSEDFIQVPPQQAFFDQINYYRTALHELSHWTGHPSRLDRKLTTRFGTKDYAREELVAELGAAFLCAELSIASTVRHADYIGSWLEVLREDKRAIFKAASLASKAAAFVLGSGAPEGSSGSVRYSSTPDADRSSEVVTVAA